MKKPTLPSSYLANDTIAAIATGLGGAIAIVRLSGPKTREILERTVKGGLGKREPRKLYLCDFFDFQGEPIDSGMVVHFHENASFTGESSAEFHVHGGAITLSRLIETLLKYGARQANPGEFSFRAVRNGKMSITQAEAVAD